MTTPKITPAQMSQIVRLRGADVAWRLIEKDFGYRPGSAGKILELIENRLGIDLRVNGVRRYKREAPEPEIAPEPEQPKIDKTPEILRLKALGHGPMQIAAIVRVPYREAFAVFPERRGVASG